MPKYWAVVTVAGPTRADLTIDGTYVPIGPTTAGGGLGGDRVIDSAADPIPFVFHARGVKGFPVTLGIVLSPLPSGTDIKFNPPAYAIPKDTGILSVTDGAIPIKPVAAANVQLAAAIESPIVQKTPAKKATATTAKSAAKKGGKGK